MQALQVIQGGLSTDNVVEMDPTTEELLKPVNRGDLGTKSWSSKVRRKAKDLAGKLEFGYMDLAKILYLVDNTPIDNDPAKGPIWKAWGYESFADYAEQELTMHRRKAQRLRQIWFRLEVELAELPEALRADITALGWSKVRELCRVLTLKNAAEWVTKAKACSYPELERAVTSYRTRALEIQAEVLDARENETLENVDQSSSHMVASKAQQIRDAGSDITIPLDALAVPEVESLYPEHFNLYKGQKDTLKMALKRASELSGSDKKGHNLDLICTDFLSTNHFLKGGPDEKLRFLAKVENLLGVKLIAIDQDTNSILYGEQALLDLAALADESEVK